MKKRKIAAFCLIFAIIVSVCAFPVYAADDDPYSYHEEEDGDRKTSSMTLRFYKFIHNRLVQIATALATVSVVANGLVYLLANNTDAAQKALSRIITSLIALISIYLICVVISVGIEVGQSLKQWDPWNPSSGISHLWG